MNEPRKRARSLERRLGPSSWRGEAPTEPLPMREVLKRTPYRGARAGRPGTEERDAQLALDLALSVGETLLRCGAGSSQVEGSIAAVAMAAGIEQLDVDITVQSILIQAQTPSGQLLTRLRVVRSPRWDFARLAYLHTLVDQLVSGDLTIAEAADRMAWIQKAPRVWSRWVVSLASGLLAAGVAIMLGASLLAAAVCVGSSMLVDWIVGRLSRHAIPDFYLSAVGGFVAVVLAWSAYILGYVNWLPITPADFAAIVAGGIVALLPARSIASAMEDVISGYPVTGTSRIFAVLFHTLGLILGVTGGLAVVVMIAEAFNLEVTAPSVERMGSASAPFGVLIIGATIVGLAGR